MSACLVVLYLCKVLRQRIKPLPRGGYFMISCTAVLVSSEPNSYKNHCGGTRWKYRGTFEIYCSTVWIPQCTLSARYYWQEYNCIIIMVLFKNHGNIMMHIQKHGNIMVQLWQMALGNCGNYEVIKKIKATTKKKDICSQVLSIWKLSEQSCFIFSIYCFFSIFFLGHRTVEILNQGYYL